MWTIKNRAILGFMIGLLILLLVGAGFVLWDRSSPASEFPDQRLVVGGVALTIVGIPSTFMLWWAVVPVIVLLAGGASIVVGRPRTSAGH
jgi:hypothetical protein